MEKILEGLVATACFVALGLSMIPLDQWLERRRARRNDQAHARGDYK